MTTVNNLSSSTHTSTNNISSNKLNENTNLKGFIKSNEKQRLRKSSCSTSSTMSTSSTSSVNSSLLSNQGGGGGVGSGQNSISSGENTTKSSHRIVSTSNENFSMGINNMTPSSTELIYHDILIIFPNGYQTVKKIDSRKAVYDLLIELSLAAKLIPTNYTLKLYNQEDNTDILNSIDEDASRIIEYTPNQTIGQLNPTKIRILPKTATLKHKQLSVTEITLNPSKSSSTNFKNITSTNNINSTSSSHYSQTNNNKSNTISSDRTSYNKQQSSSQQPFELTIRVDVILPYNQRTVVRVKPDISLDDLLCVITQERSLDKNLYDLLLHENSENNNNNKNIQSEKRIISIESMRDPLQKYKTKEVILVLKGLKQSVDTAKNLNSKSTHSLYTQNVLKTRTQPKSYFQNSKNVNNNLVQNVPKTNIFEIENDQANLKNRSKSELDLSIKSTNSSKSTKSKENITKNTSMFGFFSRKKNSDTIKSRTSLNVMPNNEATVVVSSSLKSPSNGSLITKSSTHKLEHTQTDNKMITNEYFSPVNIKTQTKKRPAPAPPTLSQTKENISEMASVDVIDPLLVEKFFTKKKTRAPPPPPSHRPITPQTQVEEVFVEASHEQVFTSPTSPTSNFPALNSESTPNSSNLRNGDLKKELSLSISSNSSPPPSISSASASPSISESRTSISNQSPKEQLERDDKIANNSLIMTAPYSNSSQETPSLVNAQVNRNSSIRSNSIYSEQNNKDDESISTIETLRQKKQSPFRTTDIESANDSSVLSQKTTSCNSSINTIDEITKSFENAINVGEKYLMKYEKSLKADEQLHLNKNNNDHNNNINNSIIIEEDLSSTNHPSFYSSDQKNYSEDEFSDIDSLKIISKSPLAHPSANMMIKSAFADKKKIRASSSNSNGSIPRPTTIVITANNDFEIKSNFSNGSSENGSSLVLDTRIPNVLIESPVSNQSKNIVGDPFISKEGNDDAAAVEPIKRTAIIEVRPTLVSSITVQDQKNVPDDFVVLRQQQQLQSNRKSVSSIPSSTSSSLSPQSSTLLFKSLNETKPGMAYIYNYDDNVKSKTLSLLRSPASPPPQFPAIGANELNEMHQNYTVIRSGDIIEKNGTYYSNDGTIRGYSGTVKKLANSTTLNEVFIKQRELEQQHEKEYELELIQKAEEEKQSKVDLVIANTKDQQQKQQQLAKTNSYTNVNNNLNGNNKNRISLGNIINNEKKSNSISTTSTLSSNSNIFKQAPFKKQNFSSASQISSFNQINAPNNTKLSNIETELTRKLQDRRDSIENFNQLKAPKPPTAATTETLEIDTNMKTLSQNYSSSENSSSNSSTHNESSPSATSIMISPDVHEPPPSSLPSSSLNNRIYEIISSENQSKKNNNLINSSHSYSSSQSSSSSSSLDMYQQSTQRPNVSSFVISAKSKSSPKPFQQPTASLNTDVISQNKSSLLNELKSLIPVLDDTSGLTKNDLLLSSIPDPPPPLVISAPSITRQLLMVPESPPPMSTFLPSKVAKAAASTTVTNGVAHEIVKSPPPMVAPKNFSNIDLSKKKQVLSMRDNLMDSIKGFNISNLRKISIQNE